jgi:succinate-semialdehyde dehydrogenase/glutarate-semialdehyde dehydrogenase
MALRSINPNTEEEISSFEELSDEQILGAIEASHLAFTKWKDISLNEKLEYIEKLIPVLEMKKEEIANAMTWEMGKPIKQSVGEIDKCILLIRYYCDHAESILEDMIVPTEAKESYVRFDPLGIILAIMPWNFPFWQAFRCIIPALIAGNTLLLKHSSNVPKSSDLINEVFLEAGIPANVFQNLHIGSSKVEQILRDSRVKGVALTGSENAGKKVAAIAGEELKKCVLELGGSDPFIVLENADISQAVKMGVTSRIRNNGQACNAAKRFIIDECVYDEFIEKFVQAFKELKIGDPMDGNIDVGPLVNAEAVKDLDSLVQSSVKKGAEILFKSELSNTKGFFYPPTIVFINNSSGQIDREIPLYNEEAFGPVAIVIKVKNKEEALQVANDTKFGLGASVWTKDEKVVKEFIAGLNDGNVFVNAMVASDPRLPFGGINASGFGRELGEYGIKEFVNIKTVWVN